MATPSTVNTSWPMPFTPFATATNEGAQLVEFDLDAIPPIFEEFYIRAMQRGLNDAELSAIIKYIVSSDISVKDKKRLLDCAVPSSVIPEEPFKNLLYWFFSNYRTMDKSMAVHVLKWVIDLLDYKMASSDVVNIFYFDLFVVLDYRNLMKYACVLLCKLTQAKDVTQREVITVTETYQRYEDTNDGKFLLAVLQVFKGFKPHLVPDPLKSVDIKKTFSPVRSGNYIMKLGFRRCVEPTSSVLKELPGSDVVKDNNINPVSKLIPCPIFRIDEQNKLDAMCFPENIEEAFALIKKPSIDNILSYLRDETGFFMLLNEGVNSFERFSKILFQKLQNVFIYQEIESSQEDKEYFLTRVYEFQVFIQQGIPSVSQFLMGFLLQWSGINYRSEILKLLEWVVFDDLKWLSANILRPFYMLFVTSNATMKHQIVRSFTNLLKNMFAAVKEQKMNHPLKKPPEWLTDEVHILSSVIKWVEELIRIGLCLEDSDNLLLETVYFYETINILESKCNIPLWTIISKGVVYRSAFKPTPVFLNRVCRLLLNYHTTFLPNLRASQPDFYPDCKDKMCITLKYAQELIALWTGQELLIGTESERTVSKEAIVFNLGQNLGLSRSQVNVETLFDLSHNANWLPYVFGERNRNGPDFLKTDTDHLIYFEYHLEHIAAFVQYFSPKNA